MEEMKRRQFELNLIQEKIKHEPLMTVPFKDRDLLRFPSIMDDRKQFDKLKYIESPLINSFMMYKNKVINGDSVERSPTAIEQDIQKQRQFESLTRQLQQEKKKRFSFDPNQG